jgi:hypothetical protein
VVLKHNLSVCMDVLERIYGKPRMSGLPASDLYPGHPEYEAGLLIPYLQCSVCCCFAVIFKSYKFFHSDLLLSGGQGVERRAFLLKFPVKYASKQISVMSFSPWIHHSH